MVTRRLAVALAFTGTFAFGALAQTADLRASGGEISAITKGATSAMSGSLGFSSSDFWGESFTASAGGELIQDRLYFFASATQQTGGGRANQFANLQLPERAVSASIDVQPGSAHDFSASFDSAKMPVMPAAFTNDFVMPKDFLSLRYTGIITPNMTVTASFSKSE